jgi:hypothetical protein
LTGILLSVALACPRFVEAQGTTRASGYRGTFGADTRNPDRAQKADASMSLTMTDDSRNQLVSRLQGERLDSWMLRTGRYTALDGTLAYQRKTQRWALGLTTTSTLQYSSQGAGPATDHSANVNISLPLGRRTAVALSERLLYAPRYQATSMLLRTGDTANTVETPAPVGAYSSATNVALSHQLGQTSTVTLHYDLQNVNFSGSDVDLRTWGAGARFSRRLTRAASLHVGYGQRIARYAGPVADRNVRIHDLEFGIQYNRSVGRLLTLTIVPGSSIVATTRGHQFRPSAEVALNRRIGRAWNARGVYRRKSEFIEGFDVPFFVDTATIGVAGFVGRRLDISGSATYSASQVASVGGASFDSKSAATAATFAITRHWALFGEYQYYDHHIPGGISGPAALASGGHSVRVGLKWWRPLR